jgi:hypothetical protein
MKYYWAGVVILLSLFTIVSALVELGAVFPPMVVLAIAAITAGVAVGVGEYLIKKFINKEK